MPQVLTDGVWHAPRPQQPLGQLAGSHWPHAPPTQVCGLVQAEHAPPPTPHAASVFPGRHWPLAEQHPFLQLIASQTHVPPMHRWPGPHCAPMPQRQVPDVQLSARVSSHATHADAPAPHDMRSGFGLQVVPEQQPEQDVASHTQLPATQCWPSAHAAPVPHWHVPLTEHESAVSPSHGLHAAPAVPHAARVRGRHASFRSQQPSGHDAAVHWHVPPTHCWPAEHIPPAPHWHAPPAEQLSARSGSQAWHAPRSGPQVPSDRVLHVLPVQQPFVQLAAQPLQMPFVHVSAAGQAMHSEPAAPHAVAEVAVTQAPVAVQQPVHDVASQLHEPPTHR